MPISFPNSPTLNQKHTEAGRTFQWNGTVWNAVVAEGTDLGRVRGAQIAGGVGRPGDVLRRTADGLEWRTLPNEAVVKATHSGTNVMVSHTDTDSISVTAGIYGARDGSELIIRRSQTLAFTDDALDTGTRESNTVYWIWQMWHVNGGSGVLKLSKSRTDPVAPANHRPARILGFVSTGSDAENLHPITTTMNGLDRRLTFFPTRKPLLVDDIVVQFESQSLTEASAELDLRQIVPQYPFGGYPRIGFYFGVTSSSSTRASKWFIGDREGDTRDGQLPMTFNSFQIPDTGIVTYGLRHPGANRLGRRATFRMLMDSIDFSLAVEDTR